MSTYYKQTSLCTEGSTSLPLLEFTQNLHFYPDLKNSYIICAQHILPTTYTLLKFLFQIGLSPKKISIIGKCYSTNPFTYLELLKDDIDVCSSSVIFDPSKSYDLQFRNNLKNFLLKRINQIKRCKNLIVLDDGGELLKLINNEFLPSIQIIGIEQTSSGFNKLKREKLRFPIINVARSRAKLVYESPYITEIIIQRLMQCIKKYSISPQKILILGNGAIGSSINKFLSRFYQVTIFDIKSSLTSIKTSEFEKNLPLFDIIIGCTGEKVLSSNHYHLLKKDVLLISASSSDREFDACKLRKNGLMPSDCHQDIYSYEKIHLINCGFPINFDADYETVDPPEFQFTRALLLSAILQASTHRDSTPGFVDLDSENQREIVNKYLELYPWRILSNLNKSTQFEELSILRHRQVYSF